MSLCAPYLIDRCSVILPHVMLSAGTGGLRNELATQFTVRIHLRRDDHVDAPVQKRWAVCRIEQEWQTVLFGMITPSSANRWRSGPFSPGSPTRTPRRSEDSQVADRSEPEVETRHRTGSDDIRELRRRDDQSLGWSCRHNVVPEKVAIKGPTILCDRSAGSMAIEPRTRIKTR